MNVLKNKKQAVKAQKLRVYHAIAYVLSANTLYISTQTLMF